MQLEMMMMSNSKLFISFFLFFLFISFVSSSFSINSHICSPVQSHALLLFKQELFFTDHSIKYRYVNNICRDWLGSGYYPITMNWKTSIDCCNWDGVICNHLTGDVIDLDLSCGMLRGTIHPNSTLFHLPHLQRLNLAFNSFFPSQLPHEIVSFSTSLTHLNLSECGFTGQVPTSTTFLHKLVYLDLSHNYFDSRLEPRVLNNLLQNSTHLRHLSLDDVHIGLVLPAYFNITPTLKLLDLRSTGLQGK
ncbi:hypothetical protein L6452_12201 [Arctium lappa]|uniref:Uncharacterized protein n=1 Tax=Arctium lappa TaxID=4217 RepID=A0ACB9DQZ0_ARCLA|nr:hypothetical protein L6452_12201 [Arctium lappa]